MAVFISTEPLNDCQIQVVEKDGEVHLVSNGHAFIKCKTVKENSSPQHVLEIHDIDGGGKPLARHSIAALCWKR